MIEYTTEIDKIVTKVEFDFCFEQEEILNLLLANIAQTPSYIVEENNIGNYETDYKEYLIYYSNIPIGAISTETISNIYNSSEYKYLIMFTFNKLKRYIETTDNASLMCLMNCHILLNQRFIDFKLEKLVICLDSVCEPDHTLGMKIKKNYNNQGNEYKRVRIESVSNQHFEYGIRRLKFELSLEEFNHMNANIHVIKEMDNLYDFFYYNYEEEIMKAENNLYSEHSKEEIYMKEILHLNMDVIENFIGTLFFSYGDRH